MRVIFSTLVLTTLSSYASGISLRGGSDPQASVDKVSPSIISRMEKSVEMVERKLSGGTFSTLDCNVNLDTAPCNSFSTNFTTATSHSDLLVIPCGECYEMDLSADTLTLAKGLDVQGKLVFPDNYQLTMYAPFVRVQGELHMTSTKKPNGQEDIKFVLTGTDETVTQFTPADSNSNECGGGDCTVGKKPIVVAGGKLVINALPPDTPTWLPLYDISTDSSAASIPSTDYDSYQAPPQNIAGCSNNGIYISEDFTSPISSNFLPTLGTQLTLDSSRLLIHSRTSSQHMLYYDLKDIRHCLEPDRVYLLTARVKFTRSSGEELTECAESGTGCFRIRHQWMREGSTSTPTRTIAQERQSHGFKTGEWINFAEEVYFTNDDLNLSNVYQSLRIDGPGAGVDIEIEHFELRLPPEGTYPSVDNVCFDLIPGNNDADEVAYNPFPFKARDDDDVLLDVRTDASGTFNYFAVSGRSQSYEGISWWPAPGCIQKDAVYRFKSDIRVPGNTENKPVEVVVKGYASASSTSTSSTYTSIGFCPPSNGSWEHCDLTWTIPASTVADARERYEMYFKLEKTSSNELLNYDVKQISFQFQGASTGIVVSNAVADTWDVGAQVLITPHTINYDDEQVRTITGIRNHTDPQYTVLELDSTFIRPTTVQDNPDFAVEVALLSRNIVFEGANDDPDHGGHLIVLHTPLIEQKIEGVEFNNFGQQGILGRYPVHFHMCGNVTGSVVSKNLIRNSNQRCIVVHRSHELLVDGNVAYDTFGHCFMTEDGNEKGNVFSGNLGAVTKDVPESGLIPTSAAANNGEETDDMASTFWITNPSNTFTGNVAAGSQTNGFWFEMRSRVRGPNAQELDHIRPKEDPLTLFDNNVAHSNSDKGIRTYPHGFIPDEQARFLNSRVYRNRGDGVFFHNSRNLAVIGGVYADNREQLDFDRAEEIEFRDASVIGVSPEYRALLDSQNVDSICDDYDYVRGIDMHTFTRNDKDNGATIENVTFSGFSGTGCDESIVLHFDDEVRRGTFDYFSTMENVDVADSETLVDACEAEGVGVKDIYITDIGSAFRPSTSTASGNSTIVGESSPFLPFLSNCNSSPDYLCSLYCEDTCLRTITYTVDPAYAASASLKLRVCNDATPPVCVDHDPTYYYYQEDTAVETLMTNTESDRFRYFSVTLPHGNYVAEFLDGAGNPGAWPTFVDETYEDAFCTDSAGNVLQEGSVVLQIPTIPSAQCDDLIKNGDAEDSMTDPLFWLHRKGGIVLAPSEGIGNSNAFQDIEYTDASMDAISQFLDSRCLAQRSGDLYEIKAWVKLIDPSNGNTTYHCDQNTESCPEVGLRAHSAPNEYLWGREPVAVMVSSHDTRDYQLVHGVWAINEEMVNANNVLFYVERNKAGLSMLVDNIAMTALPADGADRCNDMLFNSDFASGDTRFWSKYNSRPFTVVTPGVGGVGDYALRTYDGSPQTYLKTGCMEANERYAVSAKYKILEQDETTPFVCDNEDDERATECPTIRLKVDDGNTTTVARSIGIPTSDWNLMFGFVNTNDDHASAEKLRLTFEDITDNKFMVVDDISIDKVPMTCDELILYPNMDMGHAWQWDNHGSGVTISNVIDTSTSPPSVAVKASSRSSTWKGVEYESKRFMDFRCLTAGTTWEVEAEIKLTETDVNDVETGASCDLTSTSSSSRCPRVRIRMEDPSAFRFFDEFLTSYDVTTWNPNGPNTLRGTFTVPTIPAAGLSDVEVIVRDSNIAFDITVNRLSIRKVV